MSEPSRTTPARKAADAYAGAIRTVLDASPGNQKELAAFSDACAVEDPRLKSFSEATISRYRSGERVADSIFLEVLERFLKSIGKPLSPDECRYLHRLREEAQTAQPDTVTSLRDRVRLLETERSSIECRILREETLKEIYRRGFDRFSRKVRETAAELHLVRSRLDNVATECTELQESAARQARQLEYAAIYSRQLEKELADSRERARLLHREAEVLRTQVRRLHEETIPDTAGMRGHDHTRVADDREVPLAGSGPPFSATRTRLEKYKILDEAEKGVQDVVAEAVERLKPPASRIAPYGVSRRLRVLQRYTRDHRWKEARRTYHRLNGRKPSTVWTCNGGMQTMYLDPPDEMVDAYTHLAAALCAMIRVLIDTHVDQQVVPRVDSPARADADATGRFRGFFEPPSGRPSAQASTWRGVPTGSGASKASPLATTGASYGPSR